jgi:hypothetical protein
VKEYEFIVDVVINLPESANPDEFRDGLVDSIIAYVEAAGGQMGGGIEFREWEGDGNDEDS